ncbi:ATP-binding protein [Streptomyces parvulus]|uniref:ATP-binding protein n=1 Tax=Streptomyces parvulus TaxID=146923 RepID=UPI003327370E
MKQIEELPVGENSSARSDAGGSAGAGGFDFQDRVAAWFAVAILASEAAAPVQGLWTGAVEQVACETGEPVDDCRVHTTDGITLALQAKRSITLGTTKTSELAKTVRQFVAQYLLPQHDDDRLVLVTTSEASGAVRNDLEQVLRRLRNSPVGSDIAALQLNARQVSAHKAFTTHVAREWEQQRGTAPSASELEGFLRQCYVWTLDVAVGGAAEVGVLDRLRASVIAEAGQATAAWNVLLSTCRQLAINHGEAGLEQLQESLIVSGVALATLLNFRADVVRLTHVTDESIEQLSSGLTTVPAPRGAVSISRSSASGLAERSLAESFLVVGGPGTGKTVILHEIASTARDAQRPVLFLQVGSLAATSAGSLQSELGLQHPLLDVLAQWSPGEAGLLVIDALDAARTDASSGLWRSTITDVGRRLPHWRVVASIRTWDLSHSPQLRTAFPADPAEVDDLDDEEVAQVSSFFPELGDLIDSSDDHQRRLLRNPFNLRLAAELLQDGVSPAGLAGVGSRLDLLSRYWQSRISEGQDGSAREALLAKLCANSVRERRLAVPAQQILSGDTAAGTVLQSLLSRSVLTSAPSIAGGPGRGPLQFAHHVLFDYAVALVHFEAFSGGLPECLQDDPDLLLFARPSIDMYLDMAWNQGPAVFCELVLKLADPGISPMAMTAAAEVMARNTRSTADLEPLLETMSSAMPAAQRLLQAAAVAVSIRVADSSLPGTGVWAAIAERLSHHPAAALQALGDLVRNLAPQYQALVPEHQRACGLAARRLMEYLWGQLPVSGARLAITAVIQTAASDPAATEALLRRAIDPKQLSERGYHDLFALTDSIERLIDQVPGMLEDLYVAVLSHKETSSEATRMGSGAVLTLQSTRQQDFDASKYSLVQSFPDVLRWNIAVALSILSRLSLTERSDAPTVTARLACNPVEIIVDDSRRWDFPFSPAGRDLPELLDTFQRHASGANEDHSQAIVGAAASAPHAASVWRRILLAAADNPALRQALFEQPATMATHLTVPDLFGAAATLIRAIHPDLDPEQSAALKDAVQALKPTDVGSDDPEAATPARRYHAFADSLSTNHPDPAADRSLEQGDWDGWVATDPSPWEPNSAGSSADEAPSTVAARDLITVLREFTDRHLNGVPEVSEITSSFPEATELWGMLGALPDTVRDESEDLLARAAEIWTRNTQTPGHMLTQARDMLLAFAVHRRPEPITENAHFDTLIPQGPRGDAARGLLQLSRLPEQYGPQLTSALKELAADPVGWIRLTVARAASYLHHTDPTLAWELLNRLAGQDDDEAVLGATVDAACRSMGNWGRGMELLTRVTARIAPTANRNSAAATCATTAGLLWVHHALPEAGSAVTHMAEQWPGAEPWLTCVHNLRGALVDSDPAVRTRALDLYLQLAEPAMARITSLLERTQALTDAEQQDLRAQLLLADTIALQIYAATKPGDSGDGQPTEEQVGLVDEATPLMHLLMAVPIAKVTHHLVQVYEHLLDQRPQQGLTGVRDILTTTGTQSGYTADSLAVSTCVKLAERILADHRDILRIRENLTALREICDIFIEAGWPQAHQLVFGIEQAFR